MVMQTHQSLFYCPSLKTVKKPSITSGIDRFSSQTCGFSQRSLPLFLPPPSRHRASIGDIIPLPATQGFPAEVTAGCRPFIIDGTAPSRNSAPIRLLFLQVPAGGVGKKITVGFLKTALTEVMQIVGFAFTDRYYGEPAAAFAATAAGTGDRGVVLRFHAYTGGIATRVRVTD